MTVAIIDTKPFDRLFTLNGVSYGLDQSHFNHIHKVIDSLGQNLINRRNLPGRTLEEKRHHIIMGELSELAVIRFLTLNGKNAKSSHNKLSGRVDPGHDVMVTDNTGAAQCSVKSSNAYGKDWQEIIDGFHFPFTRDEVKKYNARAYFILPVQSSKLVQSEIDWYKNERKDVSISKWKRVEDRDGKPIQKDGKDQFHCKIITLLNTSNMHQLYGNGRLIAVAEHSLLINGPFEEYKDPNFQVTREMSKIALKDGDTFDAFASWLR